MSPRACHHNMWVWHRMTVQAHIRTLTETRSLCRCLRWGERVCGVQTRVPRPRDTERPAGAGAGAGARRVVTRFVVITCRSNPSSDLLALLCVLWRLRGRLTIFPHVLAELFRLVTQSHSISNTFYWGSMGGKIEKWRQYEQSPRQSQHKVRISWIYFIIIKHRGLEEMYLGDPSKKYLLIRVEGNRMIKSYFEQEITSCLMFIVSRPQKGYLFLKYIKNTSSSYNNSIKTVFKSFGA